MRKKIGNKFVSLSVSTPDGKELSLKLRALVWEYLDKMRPYDAGDALDLALFMMYCSYVSRNAEDFELEDLDPGYSIDEVLDNLGNKYLATDFIEYYATLHSQNPVLPDLAGASFHVHDLSRAITAWAGALEASGLSLLEGPEAETAATVASVLADVITSNVWGKVAGEFSSPLPIAQLNARFADVKGMEVLDFACGNGMYLATALTDGARSVLGRDYNFATVMRAAVMCFFADPHHAHDIRTANLLLPDPAVKPVQRVLVAPPFGAPLRDIDIADKAYFNATLNELVGEDAPRPRNIEDFCVAKALASLEDGGIAVLHMSPSFLFHQHKGREAIRRSIVEKGYLRAVIELPGGCLPSTAVKSALLILEKEPTEDGVFIVDLDSNALDGKGYLAKGRGKCEITEAGIEWLVNTVKNRKEIPLVSTIADRETIIASGSNLCYSAYGSVYDFQSVLDQTRTTADIVGDMQSAQATIEDLGTRIDDLLLALGKGRN